MVKIQSQAGNSLADIYDVQGSISGIDSLESSELPIVHEMGATVFSERIGREVLRATTIALAQNLNFDIPTVDNPPNVWRILGLVVLADVAGRVDHVQVSIRDPNLGREVPIFIWDSNDGGSLSAVIRIIESGGASADQVALIPSNSTVPNICMGIDQPEEAEFGGDLVMRGVTSAFGAGTVTVVMLSYIAAVRPVGGISSRGLPIPGW